MFIKAVAVDYIELFNCNYFDFNESALFKLWQLFYCNDERAGFEMKYFA